VTTVAEQPDINSIYLSTCIFNTISNIGEVDVSRASATLIVYKIPNTVKFAYSKLSGIFFRVVTRLLQLNNPDIKYYEDLVGIGIMDASAPDPKGYFLCNTFK
jgi:biotin-(acetyl-CoA carboxylase) ligase